MAPRFAIIALAALCLVWPAAAVASTVIYYGDDANGWGIFSSNMLINMAGHFDGSIVTRDIASYQADDLSNFEFAFFIGTDWEESLPPAFLDDVRSNTHRILWINGNFEQLTQGLGHANPFPIRYFAWNEGGGRDRILYKGNKYSRKGDSSFTEVQMTDEAAVYSWVSAADDTGARRPHFVCGVELCFLAENPFFSEGVDDRLPVLADLLHEFYRTGAGETKQAMIRFEDLNPGFYDPEILVDYANELDSRGVPFGFSVIPVFIDPEGLYYPAGTTIRLSESPDFAKSLNYLLLRGGTMVMHGYTHQHGQQATAAGWEFVQDVNRAPLDEDSEDMVRQRISDGLDEFKFWGWEPKIWETPHYAASFGDYQIIAEYFDACWDRPLVFSEPYGAEPIFGENLSNSGQTIPYFSQTGEFGMAILPENLGYIDTSVEASSPKAMLEMADRMALIRDFVPTFFFHHNVVQKEDVFLLIDGLIDRGYTFVSPEEFIGDDGMKGDENKKFGDDDDDNSNGSGCGC